VVSFLFDFGAWQVVSQARVGRARKLRTASVIGEQVSLWGTVRLSGAS
jgi:hypothetical protein